MDDINLKQRLVGAVVLVSLAVIFIPLILDGRDPAVNYITKSNIPPKPEREFVSRVIPLNPSVIPQPEVVEPEAVPEPVKAAPTDAVPVPVEATKADSKPAVKDVAAKKPVETRPEPVVEARPTSIAKPKTGLSAWAVQVGSFSEKKNAYALRDSLRKQGFSAFVDTLYTRDVPNFRVRVGPEIKRERADALQEKLAKVMKAKPIVVKHP